MAFKVDVVLDSKNEYGQRLTTLELTYPRFIHSEFMTHRDRERNAASSRAIPFPVMTGRIMDDPVIPIAWGAEQKGMQTGGEISPSLAALAEILWGLHRDVSIELSTMLHNIGDTYKKLQEGHAPTSTFLRQLGMGVELLTDPTVSGDERIHKSIPNRLNEPHAWITVVTTATAWKNLFRLRCDKDAEIHFQKIAKMTEQALADSVPNVLKFGDWHLPYIDEATMDEAISCELAPKDEDLVYEEILRRVSVSRCARVSYMRQDAKKPVMDELAMFDRLCQGSGFGHWSPHGHVAMSGTKDTRSGPFVGFLQYRKLFANECAD